MQRRAATIYFVFFIVMAASAYSVIAVAEQPDVTIEGETYSANESFTLDGREYTVTQAAFESSSGGGGHGGGGGGSFAGAIAWTNESFQYSAALANNSTVPYQDGTYRVLVQNDSGDPTTFTLRQEFNVSARLQADEDVENQVYTGEDGSKFVRYTNGTTQPLDEYLPAPETFEFSEGDGMDYEGNATTVDSVTASEVTLVWTGAKSQSVSFGQGENVTLSGTQFFAYFEGHDDTRVTLARANQQYAAYQTDLARQDYFQERLNGLWGIVILSLVVAALVVSMAMMPKKG